MQTNNPGLNLDAPDGDDDDMLPEYDFSQGVRNNQQRAAAIGKYGYSVTIHHADGTSITHPVAPSEVVAPADQSAHHPVILSTLASHD
jgi:hypothetical protein